MKTKIMNDTKGRRALKKCLTAVAFLGLWNAASAQTGTCTVIQQPCNGNGELAVHVSGLTLPLTYFYYDGASDPTHNSINSFNDTLFGISSTVMFVSITDAVGVNYYIPSTGMVAPFSVDMPSVTDAVCPALNGTAHITINGGTAPASVQWFDQAGAYAGTGNPMLLPPGDYNYTITSAAGCTVSSSDSVYNVHINNVSGIALAVSTTSANCTNGTAVISSLSGGMAPYTYAWSNGASTAALSGLTQGSYSVTVTDARGCHEIADGYVAQAVTISPNPVVSDATCLQNNGAVTTFGSGGTPSYTYAYSNGMTGQTISGIPGNTSLSVTVTDAIGCTGEQYLYISTSTPVLVSYSTTASSCTAPTGSATLAISGGTAPYTINWGSVAALSVATISGMAAGSYSFTVTDAVGCLRTGIVVIPPQSTITASASSLDPVCPATIGTVSATVSGSNPPFTYLWNTGATTAMITSAPVGGYSCVITDNVGCEVTKYTSVTPDSPISIGLSTTDASCIFSADGSILANPVGGSSPYVYSWSDGQTGATASGLITGNYSVYVTDASGCTQNSSFSYVGYNAANTSCYCTITGKVYRDLNNNCVYDSGEPGIEHIMMHCDNSGYAFTDANGDYSFLVPGGSYTLSESVQYTYPLASCQSNAIAVTTTAAAGCVNTINFANNMNVIHDLHILRTSFNNAIPGNTYTQGVIIMNDGTVSESTIQLGYRHDGQLSFTGTMPSVYTQADPIGEPDWYSVTSGFPTMAAGSSTMLLSDNIVPTNIPLATTVNFYDTVSAASPMSSWLSDYTPWNNVQHFQTTIIGSYDPNFKEVSPKGYGAEGNIQTSDSVLDYVVHFQNTGSYYAQKVVVTDTLDNDLDWSTLRMGYSDHAYTATMTENGVVTFTFNNIHLDWKANNDMASRGLISYSVKQKPHLSPGIQIKNRAAIYFDYNAPVFTNQTLNTIEVAAGITEADAKTNVSIYPNPATDELTVNMEQEQNVTAIHIYDLQGRLVQTEKVNKNNPVQKVMIGNLMDGLYFIELEKTDGQKVTARFIKN